MIWTQHQPTADGLSRRDTPHFLMLPIQHDHTAKLFDVTQAVSTTAPNSIVRLVTIIMRSMSFNAF